ncbi:IS3 family transposase [Streptomyces sp. NPDC060064]|uniref:IS3 family transposase n=1 Tax=Streptomyces sp. NPDC060064 TaxID=3347049 RepID=UPI0036778762
MGTSPGGSDLFQPAGEARFACEPDQVPLWFYKWRSRPEQPTKREVSRAALAGRITHFFNASGRTYGSPRVTLDLWAEGWQVSQNTVAEIMAGLGLQGRKPPRRRKSLTRQGKRKAARDLVRRRFDAIAPDVLWWGDMTEIAAGEGSSASRPSMTRSRAGYWATRWATGTMRPWSARHSRWPPRRAAAPWTA